MCVAVDSLLCNISEKVSQDIISVGFLALHATMTLEKVQFLGEYFFSLKSNLVAVRKFLNFGADRDI